MAASLQRLGIVRLIISGSLAVLGIIGYPGHLAVPCLILAMLTVLFGGLWLGFRVVENKLLLLAMPYATSEGGGLLVRMELP